MANRPKLKLFGPRPSQLPQESPAGRTATAIATGETVARRAAEIREAQYMRAIKGDLAARPMDIGNGITTHPTGARWGGDQPGDIVATLTKLVETLPPAPFYASSRLFARNTFWQITAKRTDYLLSHPDTWAAALNALSRNEPKPCVPSTLAVFDPYVVDLDTDAGRKWAGQHLEFIDAMLGTSFAALMEGTVHG